MITQNSKIGLFVMLVAAGCSQIIGLSDYEVDPSLDAGGEGGQAQGEGGGDTSGSSGKSGSTQGGEPSSGGSEPIGGEPPVVGGGPGAGGAPPLGDLVPCDSQDCCDLEGGTAVGQEMLSDGTFEAGFVLDGLSPWKEVTFWTDGSLGNDVEIISNNLDFGFEPHAGDFWAYLSGFQFVRHTIYSENFVVPADAGWMVVSGYRLFQIDTQDDINLDFCGIGFYGPAADDLNLVELPFYWGRPSDSTDGWGAAPTWRTFEASWDALPHQGQTRHLGIRGESDDYSTDVDITSSSYHFDDVSLKVYRCYK